MSKKERSPDWLSKRRGIGGIDGLRLETLAETTGLPLPLLVSLYPQGEGELCMDAVEYAGELWLERMEAAVRDGKTPADRLHRLIREYALGSDSHPEALDMYVDLWKRAKDGDGYIRRRLAAIYSGYKERFVQMARMHVAAKTDGGRAEGDAPVSDPAQRRASSAGGRCGAAGGFRRDR